jgi:hypothetical protein
MNSTKAIGFCSVMYLLGYATYHHEMNYPHLVIYPFTVAILVTIFAGVTAMESK